MIPSFLVHRIEDGTILVEGLFLSDAVILRRRIEKNADVAVEMRVSTNGDPEESREEDVVLFITNPDGGQLPEDEDAYHYRMWIGGWFIGREEIEIGGY